MKVRSAQNDSFSFWCFGCEQFHSIHAGPNGWKYNGDPERPTFQPSVLIRNGHFAPFYVPGDSCWCTFASEPGELTFKCATCHLYITDGQIQYLSDCSHSFAGQTVEMKTVK